MATIYRGGEGAVVSCMEAVDYGVFEGLGEEFGLLLCGGRYT